MAEYNYWNEDLADDSNKDSRFDRKERIYQQQLKNQQIKELSVYMERELTENQQTIVNALERSITTSVDQENSPKESFLYGKKWYRASGKDRYNNIEWFSFNHQIIDLNLIETPSEKQMEIIDQVKKIDSAYTIKNYESSFSYNGFYYKKDFKGFNCDWSKIRL